MKIGKSDTDAKVLVVAEIGNNHEGNAAVAAEMVRRAAAAGVGAVKFQTVRADQLVRRSDEARFERLKRFELSASQFEMLSRLAHELELAFVSTPLYLDAVEILDPLVDAFKIASGDNNFAPLVRQVAATGKPAIISTGVSDVARVDDAVRLWQEARLDGDVTNSLALLQCVSSYPAPVEEVGLQAIRFLADRYGCTAGFSDHSLGIEAAVLSVAAGARIIEKHFTLDKNYSDFRDHQLSADPREMAELVRRVMQAEVMLGAFDKRIQPSEAASASTIRRTIVASGNLAAGATIRLTDLKWIRPAGGLDPGQEDRVVGRKLKRAVAADSLISEADVE